MNIDKHTVGGIASACNSAVLVFFGERIKMIAEAESRLVRAALKPKLGGLIVKPPIYPLDCAGLNIGTAVPRPRLRRERRRLLRKGYTFPS